MKIVIDAMGAPASSGGMNLYARELIKAWAERFSEDELLVIGGNWVLELASKSDNITPIIVRSKGTIRRAWTQIVSSGIRARRSKADCLLSMSPMASIIFPAEKSAVVVHDWRHRNNPTEFRLLQRAYRFLWVFSLRRVRTKIAISEKTKRETERYGKVFDSVVIENGGDHPKHWRPTPKVSDSKTRIVTYGHLNNKRPEAVILALPKVLEVNNDAVLTVLGARGAYAAKLLSLATTLGVENSLQLPGYVTDSDYQKLLQESDVVVLNSSDEGYGLPVAEANYFGIPVLAAADSGLEEIHGSNVSTVRPTANDISMAIISAMNEERIPRDRPTWGEAAQAIRELLPK